ncbi:hypothetical protein EUTSA_v10024001mg [Eutrema salsugineum]|uniref:Uncharacterized protein n=1 Tax=Eutrema salsugineum TaxID=72664 RepID=V4KIU5_EUTSA|nr:hypothetical protein EUTSA_v10024001mg [Eutrema salsugineum]
MISFSSSSHLLLFSKRFSLSRIWCDFILNKQRRQDPKLPFPSLSATGGGMGMSFVGDKGLHAKDSNWLALFRRFCALDGETDLY